MKFNIQEMAKRKLIEALEHGIHKPAKDHVVYYTDGDSFIEYLSLDVSEDRWELEDFQARQVGRVRSSDRVFEVYRKL